MRDPSLRIEDMLVAIEDIQRHVTDRAAFEDDEVLQGYVLHRLMILGEAAYSLPAEFRDRYPDAPWRGAIGVRHILVHGYFKVALGMVWQVISEDLPTLKAQLEQILAGLEG